MEQSPSIDPRQRAYTEAAIIVFASESGYQSHGATIVNGLNDEVYNYVKQLGDEGGKNFRDVFLADLDAHDVVVYDSIAKRYIIGSEGYRLVYSFLEEWVHSS